MARHYKSYWLTKVKQLSRSDQYMSTYQAMVVKVKACNKRKKNGTSTILSGTEGD